MPNNFITPEQAATDIINMPLSDEIMATFDDHYSENKAWTIRDDEAKAKAIKYMALGGQLKGLNHGST